MTAYPQLAGIADSAIVIASVVYVRVGQRYQNRGEDLLEYGCVCFGAFKYQHRLAKFA